MKLWSFETLGYRTTNYTCWRTATPLNTAVWIDRTLLNVNMIHIIHFPFISWHLEFLPVYLLYSYRPICIVAHSYIPVTRTTSDSCSWLHVRFGWSYGHHHHHHHPQCLWCGISVFTGVGWPSTTTRSSPAFCVFFSIYSMKECILWYPVMMCCQTPPGSTSGSPRGSSHRSSMCSINSSSHSSPASSSPIPPSSPARCSLPVTGHHCRLQVTTASHVRLRSIFAYIIPDVV